MNDDALLQAFLRSPLLDRRGGSVYEKPVTRTNRCHLA